MSDFKDSYEYKANAQAHLAKLMERKHSIMLHEYGILYTGQECLKKNKYIKKAKEMHNYKSRLLQSILLELTLGRTCKSKETRDRISTRPGCPEGLLVREWFLPVL